MSKGKKSKNKGIKNGYQPTGGEVSWEVAMSQAIVALDHSAALAIKNNSPDGLKEVARGWLAVAETLSETGHASEEGDELDISDEYQIGFRGVFPELEEEEEGEDIYEPEFTTKAHHTFPTSRARQGN